MTRAPTPARRGRVYAGHRSAMGVHHWQELGWDLQRATVLATYGHQARAVVVLDGDAVTPLCHYPYHSPTGFEWGYNGSGPSDLARCILLDYYGVTPTRRSALYPPVAGELPVSYQAFKFAVIGRLPAARAWSVTSSETRRGPTASRTQAAWPERQELPRWALHALADRSVVCQPIPNPAWRRAQHESGGIGRSLRSL